MGTLKDELEKKAKQLGIEPAEKEAPLEKSKKMPNLIANSHSSNDNFKRQKTNISSNRKARAPYNFVPLNESLIEAEQPLPGFDDYSNDRFTGFIKITIETKTPIYIRGLIEHEKFKSGTLSKQISDFFCPSDIQKIPGSSLRGLVRNLIEIVSWGKFIQFDDINLYYRGLADQSNLKSEYQKYVFTKREGGQEKYSVSAGYLMKRGHKYFISPAKSFGKIHKNQVKEILGYEPKDNTYHFNDKGECIVVSGKMPNKHHDWLIAPFDEKAVPIPIPEIDMQSYVADKNRNSPNLLEKGNDKQPCFYVVWRDATQKDRVTFGNTVYFRVAYEQSIGEKVPQFLQDKTKVDIAEAIFGCVSDKQIIAGRVYFEDATLTSTLDQSECFEAIPQILASPKPTTFQHYLVQDSEKIDELNHYNSDTIIRGYKQYWHRNIDWQSKRLIFAKGKFFDFLNNSKGIRPSDHYFQERAGKIFINFSEIKDQNLKNAIFQFIKQVDKDSQYAVVTTIPKGKFFEGKIRFENLSKVELGALLFVLELSGNCMHKIGMGKPIGMGSVKIMPKLYLSNRPDRYRHLNSEWTTEIKPKDEKEIKTFISAFEDYIIDRINADERPQDGSHDLWKTYRLRQLETMLDWDNTNISNWNDKTRYLEIQHPDHGNEFKKRPVLPLPEDVVND